MEARVYLVSEWLAFWFQALMSSSGEGLGFKILQKDCLDCATCFTYASHRKKFHDGNQKNNVYEYMKKKKLQHVLEHEKD